VLIREIMETVVLEVAPDESMLVLSRLLDARRVGSAIVVGDGQLEGIVTERDVVRAVAMDVDLKATPVSEYMSRVVTSVVADEDMDVAARLMASQRIRHLPVLDGNRVVGVISIRDVVRFCVGDTTRYDEGQHLHELVDLV
jgi:CBS domain-containing protein